MSPAAVKPTYHQTPLQEAVQRARVDEEGHVYVRLPWSAAGDDATEGVEEHYVGQYSAEGSDEDAVQYFTRKFDDLYNRVLLLAARVATQADSASHLRSSRDTLVEELDTGHWMGDVESLKGVLGEIATGIDAIAEVEAKQNEEAINAKMAAREEIVAQAEELAAADPDQQHWKTAQAKMTELFDAWKSEQRTPPRLSKAQEDPLWRRFRDARSTFERNRKAFFVRRDKEAAEIKRAKEELIAEAESMQHSTEWGATTKAYHRLMDRWKALGRGPRKTEDAQWKRFRAAQDVFFSARDEANAKIDAEYGENLKRKEEILAKLHELMPFTKPDAVRERYQKLLDEYDAAGRVPRGDVKRMERAISEVQEAFREADGAKWSARDSVTNDRQNDMISQLQDTIADLEAELQEAEAAGDQSKIKEISEALKARRSWYDMLRSG